MRSDEVAQLEALRDDLLELLGRMSAESNRRALGMTSATAMVNTEHASSRAVWSVCTLAVLVIIIVPICAAWAIDHASMEARTARAERAADMRQLEQLRDELKHAEQRIDVQQIQIDKVLRASKL